jgi:hypothetical protein
VFAFLLDCQKKAEKVPPVTHTSMTAYQLAFSTFLMEKRDKYGGADMDMLGVDGMTRRLSQRLAPEHQGFRYPDPPTPPKGAWNRGSPTCDFFQLQRGCDRAATCTFKHICATCHSPKHGAATCPRADQNGEGEEAAGGAGEGDAGAGQGRGGGDGGQRGGGRQRGGARNYRGNPNGR